MPFTRQRGEKFTVTCADCGNECQIPFKPRDARPVYCKECFSKHKPEESRGSRFRRNERRSGFGRRDRGPREMFTATCGDCGNECKIPFEPKTDKPVYCDECFPKHKPSSGGFDRPRRSGFGRRDRGPREMFTATCGDCGNECQIPFKPRGDKPVYCSDCFQNHK